MCAMAWCWARREGRAEAFCEIDWWRVWVRALESVVRRWSFSGFRGTGGAGMVEVMGRELSNGESKRSGGGGGFCGCCGC